MNTDPALQGCGCQNYESRKILPNGSNKAGKTGLMHSLTAELQANGLRQASPGQARNERRPGSWNKECAKPQRGFAKTGCHAPLGRGPDLLRGSQGGVRVRRGLALGWLVSGLWPASPTVVMPVRSCQCWQRCACGPLARIAGDGGSIPHIALINLQPVLAAQRAEFILKRHLAMVLLLRRNVFADLPDVRLAHGE